MKTTKVTYTTEQGKVFKTFVPYTDRNDVLMYMCDSFSDRITINSMRPSKKHIYYTGPSKFYCKEVKQ